MRSTDSGPITAASCALGCRPLPGAARRGVFLVAAAVFFTGAFLAALGAGNVHAPGILKHAAPPLPVDPAELDRLRGLIAGRPAWVAASTHPGEEAAVLQAHRALHGAHPGLLTIVAPRHPHRGAEVAALLDAPRRSLGGDPAGGLWVVDTMGELGLLFRLAPVVFMGGSLVGHGGQNPWEPARLRCAVAVGPHTANFAEAVAALGAAGGLAVVGDAAGLAAWVDAMLRDPSRRGQAQDAALRTASGSEGLPARTADALLGLMR